MLLNRALLAGVAAPKRRADAKPNIKYFTVLCFERIELNMISSGFSAAYPICSHTPV
jgi:hypothetical protein